MITKKELCLAIVQNFELRNPGINVHDKNYDQTFIYQDSKLAIAWGFLHKLDPDKYPISKDYLEVYANSKSRDTTLYGYTDKNSKFHNLTFMELLNLLPD